MSETKSRRDVCAEITARIIEALERGVRPWAKPWKDLGQSSLPLRITGEPYKGANVVALWLTQQERGYTSRTWMTYQQALDLKAHVRKGEKGTLVFYWGATTKEKENESGELEEHTYLFAKGYTVFNVDQIEGLPEKFCAKPQPIPEPERNARCDAFFANTGATIRHGGDRAFYCPSTDHVQMPVAGAFESMSHYYGTLAHECVHWTGAEKRLARTFGKRFGDEAYAAEELVAEMGAAFVCAALGLETENAIREDHASYIDHWLSILKTDKRALFTVASKATAALEYLESLQPEEMPLAA